jgi:hypothetical protein
MDDSGLRLYHWNEWNPEDHIDDEHSWIEFLREHGSDVFGDDYWESGAIRVGKCQNPIINIHKTALDAALKQLADRGIQVFDGEPHRKRWVKPLPVSA